VLTSRERVLCALNHEEPDRVPIFFGASAVTSMLSPAYERFKAHLGVVQPARYLSRAFQYARLDEEVMHRFGSDGRPLVAGPALSIHRRDISDDAFVDDWGIEWVRAPGTLYYEVSRAPLRHATLDDLERYAWPDLAHPSRFTGLAEEARKIRAETECAVIGLVGGSPLETCMMLRDMESFLTDLAANREFAEAMLHKVSGLLLAGVKGFLSAAGEYVDIAAMGDDLGAQDGPLISPRMYRDLVKPHHAELFAAVKAQSHAKIFLHSCGGIYPLIGDLIEAGVDVLNPVQVSAKDMGDTARLKRQFGDRLAFCGAIDTHRVLPHGSAGDVRSEVRRRIADLAPGGGYILAAVHCIQPDVPVGNVIAMFDEAQSAGRYPLK